MKILLIASLQSIHVWQLLTYFRDREHKVFCFTEHPTSHNPNESYRNIPNKPLPENIKYFFMIGPQTSKWRFIINIPRVKKIISEVKPDLVVARSLMGCGLLARYSGFNPYILIGVGSDVNGLSNAGLWKKILARDIIANADYIWVLGKHFVEIISGIVPSTRERLFFQTHGIDPNLFAADNSPENGVSTILCTRGFLPVYNQTTLIKAFSILTKKYPKLKLVLIGEGKTQIQCQTLSKRLGVNDKIEWLGYVPQKDIVEIMKKTQVYVSVSLSDSIPVSLLEAMAMGLFPVVSDIPANHQWVQDGLNGFIVPPTDEKALAEALTRAIESPLLRAKSREINLSLIREKADIYKNLTSVEELFISIVEKRKRNGLQKL